ncbi:hypothetical protein [Massilia antarctica]|uniref:hypothetical protein n=1 Tax=Massilia antarctica TaxID=2765360 RepID=UPI0035A6C3EB
MNRVVREHARRVIGVIGVRLLGLAESPMILASHRSGCLQRGHVGLGGSALAPNRDDVLLAPSRHGSIAEAEFSLNLARGLVVDDVLLMNQGSEGDAVREIDHWVLSTVEDIRIVAHFGSVYNLSVQEDETYIADGFVVHNCRSSEIAVMKTFRELGIDLDEPEPGTRASSSGPISAKTTFAEYLTMKGTDYQNEVLGPGRAEMFRRGLLSPRDLVNMSGRPLKLSALKEMYSQ